MIARISLIFLCVLASVGVPAVPVHAQAPSSLSITTPRSGDALQGSVTINGSNTVLGFFSSDVSFSYSGDTTGTWFLISTVNAPINEGPLTTWDTTSITDGNYSLRLRVYLDDGTTRDTFVYNLRVRNYTPIETPTPAPTAIRPTPVPTITLTPTPFPTPTLMPANDAILTPTDVSITIGYGGIAAVILLGIIGFYLWLRKK